MKKEKSMEAHAKGRQKSRKSLDSMLTPSPATASDKPHHDPNWDVNRLMDAAEVTSDRSRFKAAKKAGKAKMKAMAKALGIQKRREIDLAKG